MTESLTTSCGVSGRAARQNATRSPALRSDQTQYPR
jgi:hypothetical protein